MTMYKLYYDYEFLIKKATKTFYTKQTCDVPNIYQIYIFRNELTMK